MAIEAIIFDKDGVLVETEALQFNAWYHAILAVSKKHGQRWVLSAREYCELSQTMAPKQFLIYAINGRIDQLYHNEIAGLYEECYGGSLRLNIRQVRGVVGFLNTVKQRYRLALATGAPDNSIKPDLEMAGIDSKLFDVMLSGENFPQNKPEPDVYIGVARSLGIVPENCLVMEDSAIGVKAAKAAGMLCIARLNPFFHAWLGREYEEKLSVAGTSKVIKEYGHLRLDYISSINA